MTHTILFQKMSKYYRNAYRLLQDDLNGANVPLTNKSATCLRMCPIEECTKRIEKTKGLEYRERLFVIIVVVMRNRSNAI